MHPASLLLSSCSSHSSALFGSGINVDAFQSLCSMSPCSILLHVHLCGVYLFDLFSDFNMFAETTLIHRILCHERLFNATLNSLNLITFPSSFNTFFIYFFCMIPIDLGFTVKNFIKAL